MVYFEKSVSIYSLNSREFVAVVSIKWLARFSSLSTSLLQKGKGTSFC